MTTLNERQRAVFAWVADGCPAREWPDYTHRSTARALQARGLVKIRGRGATWSIEITDLGRAVIDGADAGRAPAKMSNPSTTVAKTQSVAEPRKHNAGAMTGQLLAQRLLEAGGTIRVPNPPAELRAAYRRALATVPHGALPDGKQIRFTGRDRGDLVIRLTDRSEASPRPAPLPIASLKTAHAAVTHLERHRDLVAVSDASFGRALLILQGLAEEAERRSYDVHRGGQDPGVEITIRGVAISVLVSEEQQKVARVSDEDRARLKYAWQRATPVPVVEWTGRLAITLTSGQTHRPTWADRKRWVLEDKLPQVLEAAEQWADEIITARERDIQLRQERRRQWDEALPKARRAYLDQINRDRLERQLDAHGKTQRLRGYADAIDARVTGSSSEGNRDAIAAWVAWIRCEADRLDPTFRTGELAYLTPDEVALSEVSKYMPRGKNAYKPPD